MSRPVKTAETRDVLTDPAMTLAEVAGSLLKPIRLPSPTPQALGVCRFWQRDSVEDRLAETLQHRDMPYYFEKWPKHSRGVEDSAVFLAGCGGKPEAWVFVAMCELSRCEGAHKGRVQRWKTHRPIIGEKGWELNSLALLKQQLSETEYWEDQPWHHRSTDLLPGMLPDLGPFEEDRIIGADVGDAIADYVLCRVVLTVAQYALVVFMNDEESGLRLVQETP